MGSKLTVQERTVTGMTLRFEDESGNEKYRARKNIMM
jgi:hypothetical protein